MPETVVVFAGGAEPRGDAIELLPAGAPVVAADGGADHALALGLRVDVAVGDFDSISPAGLAALEAAGTRIERHRAEKDATDLELALDAAVALGPSRVIVVGGVEGRLDHLIGELLLVGAEAYAGVQVDAFLGSATVHVIRGERTLEGTAGETISLFALHGGADGVVTEGLEYPLRGERLPAGTSRGTSNAFAGPTARIAVERGVVLAVRPG